MNLAGLSGVQTISTASVSADILAVPDQVLEFERSPCAPLRLG
jgi:hypothetical protein